MRKEKYISEHKSSKYHYLQVYIHYKDDDGKDKRLTKNFNIADYKSPGEAMKAAKIERDRILAEIASGRPIKSTPTVGGLFLRTKDLFITSTKTWDRHVATYNKSVKAFEGIEITKIKASDIQQTLNDAIEKYSVDATKRVLSVWRQIYRAALMDGINVPDLTQIVSIPKDRKPIKEKRNVMISHDDFQQYIEYLTTTSKFVHDPKGRYRRVRIMYMLQVMYFTGMRPAEAMALDRDDFDLTNKVIHITKAVGSTKTQTRQIVRTKTEQSVRDIPISEKLMPIITDMLINLPGQHMFYDYDGLPFEIDFLSNFVTRTAKDAGIEFNMYMLRHSFIHNLGDTDIKPRVQQDIVGHATYDMTLKYDRSTDKERKQAIDKVFS